MLAPQAARFCISRGKEESKHCDSPLIQIASARIMKTFELSNPYRTKVSA